jgi:hypothetical protein
MKKPVNSENAANRDELRHHLQGFDLGEDETCMRGQEIIRHAALGIDIHLFVRENKLAAGKAAPFTYHGLVLYQSHQGSQPMSVVFGLTA